MTEWALYSEIDPFAAAWLSNLIAAGHIMPGVVDTRSLEDLTPDECNEFRQVHLCAGIGVWSHALRMAGWADNRAIWTASFPCQPFSAAGKGAAFADERHIWPAGHWLIDQCSPAVIAGEQVASKDGLAWLDVVSADLEASGYAVGSSVLSAAGFGASHPRHRTYFVGHYRRSDADDSSSDGRHCAVQMGRGTLTCSDETLSNDYRNKRGLEPRPSPVAYGVAYRMEQCRAYGNALDARCATGFLSAAMECMP